MMECRQSVFLAVVAAFAATTANAATVLYEAPQGFEKSVVTQMEAVVDNPLPQWPKTADRLYIEIWGAETDEAFAKVNVSGSKGGKAAKREFRWFDLPQNGLRTATFGLRDLAGSIDLSAVSNITVRVTGRESRPFTVVRVLLLDKGEAKPDITEAPRVYPIDAAQHHADYLKFRDECRSGAVVAGVASSMVAIRPRAAFKWKPMDDIRVRLARGENESFQILVAPADGDLKNVQVQVEGDLEKVQSSELGVKSSEANDKKLLHSSTPPLTHFSMTNISACVVGYVENRQIVNYEVRRGWLNIPRLGWWPDAILDFQKTTDIKGEDVQSFWVRVNCPTNQPAGDYMGRIKVTVGEKVAATGALHVRVNDFAVGRVAPLPMIVCFDPDLLARGRLKKGEKIPDDDYHVAWKTRKEQYCDWLADYYVTWCDYYTHFQHWDMLLRLKEQGRLNCFNLAFWWRVDGGNKEAFRKRFIPHYRNAYEKAKELGLLDHAVFGGCSEQLPKFHKGIAQAVDIMKEEFPGVPIISSVKDRQFGTGDSPLKNLDAFIPLVRDYNPETARKAREEGRKVWWYICNWPPYPCINALIEQPPSNLRVLMGALSQKCKPDGFLYWSIAWWNGKEPVTKGPWIDWSPCTFGEWHGDGQWTYCGGPDLMPIATLRLENFRDGIDDLWYAKLLEQKLSEVESSELRVESSEWIRRAKAALAVPDKLAKNGFAFTSDPEVIYRWRNEMADLIENAR